MTRVSTQAQADDGKISLEDQERRCRAYAQEMGWKVIKVISVGHSGRDAAAPHLKELDQLVAEHQGQNLKIIFDKMDRAFRSLTLGLTRIQRWAEHGAEIYIGRQKRNLDDADSRLFTAFELMVSEHKAMKNSNAANAKHAYASQGTYYANPPLGYIKDEDRKLHPTPEASLVSQVFLDVIAYQYWGAIHQPAAQELNLDPASLTALIQNPTYRGVVPYGDEQYPFEPYRIVSDATWHEAQEHLPERHHHRRSEDTIQANAEEIGTATLIRHLMTRVEIRCLRCGSIMRLNATRKIRGREIAKLRCPNGHEIQFIANHEIEALLPLRACFNCGERSRKHLRAYKRKKDWIVICHGCGWSASVPTFPFGRYEPPDPHTTQSYLWRWVDLGIPFLDAEGDVKEEVSFA